MLVNLENLNATQKMLKIEEIASNIKKGTYVGITYKKEIAVLKNWLKDSGLNVVPNITKWSHMTCRLGIDYHNTNDYDNHEHNKVMINNRVLSNLFEYNEKTNKHKLRVFKTSLNEKVNAYYTLNGERVGKNELNGMISTTEFKPHTNDSIIFTIMLDNVLAIEY